MVQIPVSILTLVAGILITLVSLWIGQNINLFPVQASEQAPLVDGFFNVMLAISAALFIVVQGAIIIFAIRFRRKKGDNSDGEPIEGSVSLEAFWTLIPAVIVMALGIYSVDLYNKMGGFAPAGHHGTMVAAADHAMQPQLVANSPEASGSVDGTKLPQFGIGASPAEGGAPADLVVNVTGLQYAWLFDYPEQNILAGELHVPINQTVQLNLSAQDVIHSFWVPQFRLKQDAIPGQPTQLRFKATRIGTYPVVCAELCGSYHGGMRTTVVVEEPDAYDGWLAENRQEVAALPAARPDSTFADARVEALGMNANVLASLHPHAMPE
jgi:cytochrome c oxidase subunit 2